MPSMIRAIRRERTLAQEIEEIILLCGEEILLSNGMEYEKTQKHHGDISCFEHSVSVAYISLWLASSNKVDVDVRSLVRGALLHDYYLYDCKAENINNGYHWLTHANVAHNKANSAFSLNDKERDIIVKHMHPITPSKPTYYESKIVSRADKISALVEKSFPERAHELNGIKLGRRLL